MSYQIIMRVIAAGMLAGAVIMFFLAEGSWLLAAYLMASYAISWALGWLHHKLGGGISLVLPVAFVLISVNQVAFVVYGSDRVDNKIWWSVLLATLAGAAIERVVSGRKQILS